MKRILSLLMALLLAVSVVVPAAIAEDMGGGAELSGQENPGQSESQGSGDTPENPPENPSTDPSTAPTTAPTDPSSAPTEPPTQSTEPPTQSTEPPTQPTEPPTQPTEPPVTPTAPPVTPTVPAVSGFPKVTKDPTGETVKEGDFAEFVARADNCIDIIWHLQSAGSGTDILCKDAPNHFPGLHVLGLNTDRLILDHIPRELNEWRVRAEFVGRDGNVWSAPAVITVMNQELSAPTIQQQPKSVNLKANEGTVLTVSAVPSDQNTTLVYQWYKSTTGTNSGGTAILGATSSSYTPDYIPGTTYYYCSVRSTTDGEYSVPANTACAAVAYPDTQGTTAATVNTQPLVTQPLVTQPTAEASLAPWQTVTETTGEAELPINRNSAPARSNSLLVVVIVVILCIAVLGIVAAFIILRVYPRADEDEEEPAPPRRSRARETVPAPRYARKPAPTQEEDEWDDLSDLGDLSQYFDDEDE